MFLCATNQSREGSRIRTAQRIMETHNTAAAFDEGGERTIRQVAIVSLIDHQDVGILQLRRARSVQRAVDDGSVFRQDLAPVRKKLRIVMLANLVGLQSRLQVYAYT